jgi:hypothetical protein
VPTPNLFTGMQNIHGPREWVSVQDMARATEMCIALLRWWSTSKRMSSAAKGDGEARLAAEADLVDWAG